MMSGRRVAIVGVGYSTVGRNLGLTEEELVIEASQAALLDAGLTVADIDGLTSVGSDTLANAWMLGISPLSWWSSATSAPAFVYAANQAIAAVGSGFCETAIAMRIIRQQPSGKQMLSGAAKDHPHTARLVNAVGDQQFLLPLGLGSPVNWAGLMTQRYMQEHGASEEDFGHHVIAQREHAALNEDALFRDPLTMQDYLASRYVSKPLRLLDCDYPCDSGSAVIFTTEERARDLAKRPVYVEAASLSAIRDLNFEILSDMVETAPRACADELWSRTDLTAADVDTAQLYDGFSIITFQWLEALGFCCPGKAAKFVRDGNTRLGGALPRGGRAERVDGPGRLVDGGAGSGAAARVVLTAAPDG